MRNQRRRVADSTLTFEHLLEVLEAQGRRCAITGKEFSFCGGGEPTNVSIDRLDCDRPYENGNVRLVCAAVNMMRQRLSDEELGQWCVDIAKGMGLWK